jgi:hypothetical protein
MRETLGRLLNAEPHVLAEEALSLAILCAGIIAIFSLPNA